MGKTTKTAVFLALAAAFLAVMFWPHRDDPAELARVRCTAESLAYLRFLTENHPDDPEIPAAQARFDRRWKVTNLASNRERPEHMYYKGFYEAAYATGQTRLAANEGDAYRAELAARLNECDPQK